MSGVRNELDDSRSYLQQLLLSVDGAEEEGCVPRQSFLIFQPEKALILERAYSEVTSKGAKLISDRLTSTVRRDIRAFFCFPSRSPLS